MSKRNKTNADIESEMESDGDELKDKIYLRCEFFDIVTRCYLLLEAFHDFTVI